MIKKVSIIGGGASGLLCAIICARASLKVDLYEQNAKVGKKILVSGNGRCNITNTNATQDNYFCEKPSFVAYALKKFGYKEFEEFCNSIGLVLDAKDDAKVYPLSNEAKSVVLLLEAEAKKLGVNFILDTKVTELKTLFKNSSSVVIATGSKAASHLGGCDDGEVFAKKYGHKIVPSYPSLVQFEINSKVFKKMTGAKLSGEVKLFIDNKETISKLGDILFTAYGLSGFAILDISQSASYAITHNKKVQISLDLLPNFKQEILLQHIMSSSQNMTNLSIIDILSGLIPSKIARGVLEHLKIDTHTKRINASSIKKITLTLKSWTFNIDDTHGFRHAEVAGGGVSVDEINPKTMQSLKKPQLYFCGEVLDVVGMRGGYNFAWAWASGYLAAMDIIDIK